MLEFRLHSFPDNRMRMPDDMDPGKFRRLSPSKMWAAGWPEVRKFKKIATSVDQCFAKSYKQGSFVASISNYHGEHLDGCGNPYLAEWWWVERLAINVPSNEARDSKRRAQRRDDDRCVVA